MKKPIKNPGIYPGFFIHVQLVLEYVLQAGQQGPSIVWILGGCLIDIAREEIAEANVINQRIVNLNLGDDV